jgi:hypothetical protein
MGTRSLTFVYDGDVPVINMYRQFDGYPSGHGAELAEFLDGIEGANGMGCLAAQLIANFKKTVGGFYIHPVTDADCGQEYEYHIYEDKVIVNSCATVYDSGHSQVIFDGSWKDLAQFCVERT